MSAISTSGFHVCIDSSASRVDSTASTCAPERSSIVVTADILLADRCLKNGAIVIGPTGKAFDAASIGNAVAQRALMADLRAMGAVSGGPAPFAKADRSRFLSALDQAVNRLKRSRPGA